MRRSYPYQERHFSTFHGIDFAIAAFQLADHRTILRKSWSWVDPVER